MDTGGLAADGGDGNNPFDSNPYFRRSSRLGKLTKGKDLPRSDVDVNKPFYHEHAILSQATIRSN